MPLSPARIGIATGDPAGVGPEVTLKSLAQRPPGDDTRYLLLGDLDLLHRLNGDLFLGLDLQPFHSFEQTDSLLVLNPQPSSLTTAPSPGDPKGAEAAMSYLRKGTELCLQDNLQALVTAPVNKASIIRAGHKDFVGQTEFLSCLAHASRTAMMLLGADENGRWLRVALATTHLALRDVPARLTREKIELAIELASQACRDLQLDRARVAVCGLNPHAGEEGNMGDEEMTTIRPAVEATRAKGLNVSGPHAADTLFHYVWRGDYDAVVAMYHDQGLVPLKMVGFRNGVNWTLGLPFIRTSPDHGTAYDIAGRGQADASSMQAAVRLARQLAANRS